LLNPPHAEKKKHIQFSKILTLLLLFNFFIIEIFVGYVTFHSFKLAETMGTPVDFAPLLSFIGLTVGETLTYLVYNIKAMKENTQGGISYELAMANVANGINANGI
jgi:hypothetical protein